VKIEDEIVMVFCDCLGWLEWWREVVRVVRVVVVVGGCSLLWWWSLLRERRKEGKE
jgi:hypothetical protein